jgi:hypothetical protein
MPLPFLAALPLLPILLGGGGGGAIIATIAHRVGKKKGYSEGHDDGKELSAAQINEYKKRLQELQKKREQVKEGFKMVMDDIASIPLTDENFFAKAAAFFKGYTGFHVYVMTCIAWTRYQVLKHRITKKDAEELKGLVLGLVASGFPNNLKNDVEAVWESSNQNGVMTTYHKYRGKLGKTPQMTLDETIISINDYIKQFAELSNKTKEFEKLIEAA